MLVRSFGRREQRGETRSFHDASSSSGLGLQTEAVMCTVQEHANPTQPGGKLVIAVWWAAAPDWTALCPPRMTEGRQS